MSSWKNFYLKILQNNSNNIDFFELCNFLKYLGFSEKIKGGHHIFKKFGIDERINIQPIGSSAKFYQVKQIKLIIVKYNIEVSDE